MHAPSLLTTADWQAALTALATPPKTDPYQEAVTWAKAHAALLVTAVTAETKATIRLLVERAFTEGIPPVKLAKLILSETSLGLTAKQAATVLKLRQKLAAHPGRTFVVAKKKVTVPENGASEAWLDKVTARYAGVLLKQRALTIARTETIAAAAAGQHSFWGKMRDSGLLRGDELRRWSATEDDKTCPICAYLDGQEVAFDEPFLTEDGEAIFTPPSHPNCRCSVVLAIGGAAAAVEALLAALYDPDQPRDEIGRWTDEGGAGGGPDAEGTRARRERDAGDARVYHRPVAIKVNTVEEAVSLIHEGKVVEVRDLKQAHTLISRLAEIAVAAEAAGRTAQDYDLCQVSVAGSNLFCVDSVRSAAYPEGIPRIDMPQLSGKAEPGSPADRLPKTERGTVNGGDAFVAHLLALGLRTQEERVPSARLRPSQRELRGREVGAMMRAPGYDPGARPIFVSRDDYVVDGHHRWAASVGRDLEDGQLGTSMMNVRRIDAPIAEVLHLANAWSRQFGIKQRGMSHLRGLYDPNQPRDESGQWTDSGGGGGVSARPGGVPGAPIERVPAATSGMAKKSLDVYRQYYGKEDQDWWVVTQDGDTYIQHAMKSFGGHRMIASGPRQPESLAIRDYLDKGYIALNQGLRAGRGAPDPQLDNIIARNTLTDEVEVYRALRSDALAGLAVGDQFEDKAYVSTTWDRTVAKRIVEEGGVSKSGDGHSHHVVALDLPKGQHALEVEQWESKDTGEIAEHEYLLPRNMRFEVTEVDRQGRVTRVRARR